MSETGQLSFTGVVRATQVAKAGGLSAQHQRHLADLKMMRTNLRLMGLEKQLDEEKTSLRLKEEQMEAKLVHFAHDANVALQSLASRIMETAAVGQPMDAGESCKYMQNVRQELEEAKEQSNESQIAETVKHLDEIASLRSRVFELERELQKIQLDRDEEVKRLRKELEETQQKGATDMQELRSMLEEEHARTLDELVEEGIKMRNAMRHARRVGTHLLSVVRQKREDGHSEAPQTDEASGYSSTAETECGLAIAHDTSSSALDTRSEEDDVVGTADAELCNAEHQQIEVQVHCVMDHSHISHGHEAMPPHVPAVGADTHPVLVVPRPRIGMPLSRSNGEAGSRAQAQSLETAPVQRKDQHLQVQRELNNAHTVLGPISVLPKPGLPPFLQSSAPAVRTQCNNGATYDPLSLLHYPHTSHVLLAPNWPTPHHGDVTRLRDPSPRLHSSRGYSSGSLAPHSKSPAPRQLTQVTMMHTVMTQHSCVSPP